MLSLASPKEAYESMVSCRFANIPGVMVTEGDGPSTSKKKKSEHCCDASVFGIGTVADMLHWEHRGVFCTPEKKKSSSLIRWSWEKQFSAHNLFCCA